jgi:hypothetical protein
MSIGLILILAVPNGRAQDSNTPTTDGTPFPAAIQATTESSPPSSKAIVLVIDADAQQSEVVKEVIAALEKAGIATGKAAETAPPTNSPISVTLNMRKDESYDKIEQLIEALKNAGVLQMSVREGGVQYQGKEINQLHVDLQPGYSPAEYEKIDLAAIAVMNQCGLSLLRARNWLPGEADVRHPLDDVNLPVSDSSERTNPAMDSGFIPKSRQTADLRTQYEAANKQAHDLAESLRQTPDTAKKAELRTAVQRAFTLRQSLLRAELQEMQARLEKTQQSLDMRDRMADQIVDRRIEDLLNPQLKWDDEDLLKTKSTITSTLTAPMKPKTTAPTIAELEGDWHRMSASGAETPHFNISIHGNTWTKFVDQNPEAVEFLCDSAKKTIEFKSTPPLVYTYQVHDDSLILHNETQTQAFNRGHRLPPDVTELEGDWRQMSSATDKDGKPLTGGNVSISFRKNQYTHDEHRCRVDVISNKKEIRYFHEGENNFFVQDHYLLEGDQLTIYDENRRTVYRRIKVRD